MTSLSKLNQYGPNFQIKVLGALLTQKKFLINVYDSLDEEYFENTAHKWVIGKMLKYFQQYHTTPTMEFLAAESKKIENEILKIALTETLREAYKSSEDRDIEWVENEFTDFCKNQQMKKAILTSAQLLEHGDFDGIRGLVNNALKVGIDKNVGLDLKKDVESRYRLEDRKVIPFPWNVINNLTQGGYGSGDLVLIFGNPKGGKSWAVTAMGAHALMLGYNVLHYALELGEGYSAQRYDAILTGISVQKLGENRDKIQDALDRLKGNLKIKEYPPRKASFDTIESHIQQLETQEEFKPDMIIIDYLDYVKSKPRKERKEEIDDVYVHAKSLAKQLKIPIISPSQANRTGAKEGILEGSHIAGSYDKIMIADILLSLARGRKDKINGTGRWHVMGNRYGPDGLTFASKIDTYCGKIEIFDTPIDEDLEEIESSKNKYDNFDEDEKEILRNKFFNNQ